TGDTAHAKELFVEMVSDAARADAAESGKPATEYAALVTKALAALKKGYEEAERAAQGRTGLLVPASGELTRPEATLLYFLGTAADTGAVKPDIPENDRWLYSNMLGQALYTLRPQGRKFPPETTKLFAAWLAARRDTLTIRKGFEFARFHEIGDTLPTARATL